MKAEVAVVGLIRRWRRRKVGLEMIESHFLETDWKRRRDFGGKYGRICSRISSLYPIKVADNGEEDEETKGGGISGVSEV